MSFLHVGIQFWLSIQEVILRRWIQRPGYKLCTINILPIFIGSIINLLCFTQIDRIICLLYVICHLWRVCSNWSCILLVKFYSCMMKLKIWKLCSVSLNSIWLAKLGSWADIIWVISSSILTDQILCLEMIWNISWYRIWRSNYRRLMRYITFNNCGTSSFLLVCVIKMLRGLFNWFVLPISCHVHIVFILIHWVIVQMRRYRLDCIIKVFLSHIWFSAYYRIHHQIIIFQNWRMNYCCHVLILRYKSRVCGTRIWILMLLTNFSIHFYSSPGSVCIVLVNRIVHRNITWNSGWILLWIQFICSLNILGSSKSWSHSRMSTNHLIFGIMRTIRTRIKAMSNCHIHSFWLDICSLQLWIISDVIRLLESICCICNLLGRCLYIICIKRVICNCI